MSSAQRSAPLRVLFVEDDENDAMLLARHLRREGYQLETGQVSSLAELNAALQGAKWDVVISDFALPGFSALEALETVLAADPDTPFIVVSGMMDELTACAMMRAGAQDYLSKDKLDRLAPVIDRERHEARIRQERRMALEAVQANEERFRALAANIPGVLFQMILGEDGRLPFLYVSEACMMLLGIPADVLMSRPDPLLDLVLPDDRNGLNTALRLAGTRGGTLNWEGRILPPGADIKWINMRCSPRTLADGRVLWEGAMWNITQSKVAESELRASRSQLAELSEHLQRVKEDERDRIARDIHDVLGGTLVGIKISAKLLAGKLGQAEPAALARIHDIEVMLDEAITTAGRVARELRPGILKEFGLAAAIESYAEDYSHRAGISCTVLCADHDIETDENISLALFRTYQEALTNVSKHAQAAQVEVRLMQEENDIVLEISDDGRGLTEQDLVKPKSFGLRGIRERLKGLGGDMELLQREPRGTTVILRAPLTAAYTEGGNNLAVNRVDGLTTS
ncbi:MULTISPECIES: hybrid sensor histidine kinase/response regulator [Uliginosibacterium]|uniref:histidine kinase n=1 Tax=Uliginosibacterium aquaticum TaxID=2731212 RepID=A0ABX2IJ42_9RHOO|nr:MULTISPECIES: response regulator [Uliginosibacterium]MDO6386021.1 response regulator [Uliginosibacterium sp. 31-12]NSL54070.1 response regulator [Uliginosibacterium aquaticum]PLK50028.1 histidine kinase [Uliginosibacterium sp. TH139]